MSIPIPEWQKRVDKPTFMTPECCPKCSDSKGFYEVVVERHTYFYTFEGRADGEADDVHMISGGKVLRCISCHKDITKFIKPFDPTITDKKETE